ncbi:substrate-binding domain-containing protein [Pokkaliibacter sp. CJK22405]|uniref:substrate-binding domain-containing protein n=1 Tax=Pokkaliibacter sp. CJK22405 TaxID=3384615 RepID=UPI0039849623
MSTPSRPATIKTIAADTGYSIATVSRALSGSDALKSTTREAIKEAAERLGYQQDRTAVRLKTGRTQVVAFILNREDQSHAFARLMLLGMTDALKESGYHVIIIPEQAQESPLDTVRFVVEQRAADGLILTHTLPEDPRVAYLTEQDIPFVTHGRTLMNSRHAYVDFDNESFAYQATRALIQKGREQICLIPAPCHQSYREHIITGYQRAITEANLPSHIVHELDLNAAPEALEKLVLSQIGQTDAYVVPQENAALPVISTLQRQGYRIGSDIDVAVKQVTSMTDYLNLPLLRCRENLQAAAQTMARQLLTQMNPNRFPALSSGQHVLQPATLEVFPYEPA